jgi:hypothetical protein
MMSTITYRYKLGGKEPAVESTWTRDRGQAIIAAAKALKANPWGTSGNLWAYYPEELADQLEGEPVVVTADALAQLGAGLLDGHDYETELRDCWRQDTDAKLPGDEPNKMQLLRELYETGREWIRRCNPGYPDGYQNDAEEAHADAIDAVRDAGIFEPAAEAGREPSKLLQRLCETVEAHRYHRKDGSWADVVSAHEAIERAGLAKALSEPDESALPRHQLKLADEAINALTAHVSPEQQRKWGSREAVRAYRLSLPHPLTGKVDNPPLSIDRPDVMPQHNYTGGCHALDRACKHGSSLRLCPQCEPCSACNAQRERRFRLDAYYYSFNSTGVTEIDELLCAVAWAGKACHNTEDWCEEAPGLASEVDRIQLVADTAAASIMARLAAPEPLHGGGDALLLPGDDPPPLVLLTDWHESGGLWLALADPELVAPLKARYVVTRADHRSSDWSGPVAHEARLLDKPPGAGAWWRKDLAGGPWLPCTLTTVGQHAEPQTPMAHLPDGHFAAWWQQLNKAADAMELAELVLKLESAGSIDDEPSLWITLMDMAEADWDRMRKLAESCAGLSVPGLEAPSPATGDPGINCPGCGAHDWGLYGSPCQHCGYTLEAADGPKLKVGQRVRIAATLAHGHFASGVAKQRSLLTGQAGVVMAPKGEIYALVKGHGLNGLEVCAPFQAEELTPETEAEGPSGPRYPEIGDCGSDMADCPFASPDCVGCERDREAD